MQKNSAFFWRPFFNEKQKKPFVLLSFISHMIMLISYCCFVKNKIHLITLYYSNKLTTYSKVIFRNR